MSLLALALQLFPCLHPEARTAELGEQENWIIDRDGLQKILESEYTSELAIQIFQEKEQICKSRSNTSKDWENTEMLKEHLKRDRVRNRHNTTSRL